jgi:putative transposase
VHVSIDHVHLVLSIAPKYSVSEVIRRIKGQVAIRLLKHVQKIRKNYWAKWSSSRRYFTGAIGVNEQIIRQYIQKQALKERQAEQLGFDY